MFEYKNYRNFLEEELARKVSVNPKYSLRAFAKFLGLSPGELSEIIRGKRKLSFKKAVVISQRLGLSSSEKNYFMSLLEREEAAFEAGEGVEVELPKGNDLDSKEIQVEIFKLISDWECFAILTLSECIDHRWDLPWIAKRLGISQTQAKCALERLEFVGLIKRNGVFYEANQDAAVGLGEAPSMAGRKYHQAMLDKAKAALEIQPRENREYISVGMAIDPYYLDKMKKELNEFVNQLMEKYGNTKNKKKVFQLQMALFELTQGE